MFPVFSMFPMFPAFLMFPVFPVFLLFRVFLTFPVFLLFLAFLMFQIFQCTGNIVNACRTLGAVYGNTRNTVNKRNALKQ